MIRSSIVIQPSHIVCMVHRKDRCFHPMLHQSVKTLVYAFKMTNYIGKENRRDLLVKLLLLQCLCNFFFLWPELNTQKCF